MSSLDPFSELREQHHLQPTVFYLWQRQLFEQGAAAFQTSPNRETNKLKQKIGKLRATTSFPDWPIAEGKASPDLIVVIESTVQNM